MKKSIFISGMVIVLVLAFTAVATFAYFYGNDTQTTTITTASITFGNNLGFPLNFTGLLPGEAAVKEFSLKNAGTREADFYFQLYGDVYNPEEPSDELNFCNKSLGEDALHIWVQELEEKGGDVVKTWVSGLQVCDLYPGKPDSVISKIGNDIGVGSRVYYRVTVKLNPLAGNEYNGGTNTDYINLIAVQYNGTAPVPDKQGFPYPYGPWDVWPLDTHGVDDDQKYP
jgi:hypothetical protein